MGVVIDLLHRDQVRMKLVHVSDVSNPACHTLRKGWDCDDNDKETRAFSALSRSLLLWRMYFCVSGSEFPKGGTWVVSVHTPLWLLTHHLAP